jgi:UDP-GlcNAc:undecaprenyl-phosphate GlcNAc-1-phosphate transferase
VVALAVAGALAGFLAYNRPPARVYLGDGGAYLLGTLSTVLLVSSWAPGRPASTGVAALLLVAIPAGEVAFAFVRRARARTSVVTGDRRHPYDLLVERGWRPSRSALAYVLAQVLLGLAAMAVAASHSVAAGVVAAGLGGAALAMGAERCGALRPDCGGAT